MKKFKSKQEEKRDIIETYNNFSKKEIPISLEAEKTILNTLLSTHDDDKIITIFAKVNEFDFYLEKHRIIFMNLRELYDLDKPLSSATLIEILYIKGLNKRVSDNYIISLKDSLPPREISYIIKILKEKSLLRAFIENQLDVLEDCYAGVELKDVIDKAERHLNALNNTGNDKRLTKISEGNAKLYKELVEKSKSGDRDIVPTHFRNIDKMIGGFCNSDLILIAARTSMGKSSLMLNLAKNQAKLGKSVAIFSLEMSDDLLRQRFVSDISEIESNKMQSKMFSESDLQKMAHGFEVLDKLPIFINDSNDVTVYQIKSDCRRMKQTHGLNIVYIDYVQFMVNTADRQLSVQQQIPAITKQLKSLAKELKIPIVLLCQLNRDVESRENKLPRMSDLKDSGSLEQDADIVMFLHRDDYYNKNKYTEFEEEDTKLFIAKNRNGKVGIAELVYKKRFFRFEDKI